LAVKKKILIIDGVHASYGAAKVLEGVSCDLTEGDIVVVLGTNGSGKSTLLKCICGVVRPSSGNIVLSIGGRNTSLVGKKLYETARLGIIFIAEGRRILRDLTVRENLLIAAYTKRARQRFKENLKIAYDLFPVLQERENQMAGTLSGGQQQMLVLAMGLLSDPRILLIDEPSQGLAPILVRDIMKKVKELRDDYGLTILMSEQNFVEAAKIADRGYVLSHGKIVLEGEVSKIADLDVVKKYYFALD